MYSNTDLNPGIEQYVVIMQCQDGRNERVSGLYKIKENALIEAARRNAETKANRETYKDSQTAWIKEICSRRFYVAKIKYEEIEQ